MMAGAFIALGVVALAATISPWLLGGLVLLCAIGLFKPRR
jgi:hypothetical protein